MLCQCNAARLLSLEALLFSFLPLVSQNIQQKREEWHMAHAAQQHGEGLQRKYQLKALMTQVATDHLMQVSISVSHFILALRLH